MNAIFNLVGGPWDGQIIDSSSKDEASSCFALALIAMTDGGRLGTSVSLAAPTFDVEETHHLPGEDVQSSNTHEYEIASSRQQGDRLVITAKHVAIRSRGV